MKLYGSNQIYLGKVEKDLFKLTMGESTLIFSKKPTAKMVDNKQNCSAVLNEVRNFRVELDGYHQDHSKYPNKKELKDLLTTFKARNRSHLSSKEFIYKTNILDDKRFNISISHNSVCDRIYTIDSTKTEEIITNK